MYMRDHEEPFQENPVAVGRGIVFGILFGTFLWAIILGLVWFWLFR
jgi:hypothetical protein